MGPAPSFGGGPASCGARAHGSRHGPVVGWGVTFEEIRQDPRARRYVLASAALGAFTATVMATSVNVALPSLVSAFEAPFALVQWVVLSYLLATATLLPIVGRLADMFGKRKLFLAGFVTFGVGSLLCGLAPDVIWLIVFRSIQGIGSSVLQALGLAIITDVFPAHERGRAIGINGAVLSTGIVLGPTLGGFLVELGWPWVFLFGVPVAVIGWLLGHRFVPPYDPGERQRFDLSGAVTLGVALAALSLALTVGQGRGFTDSWILAAFGLSLAALVVFVFIERRASAPVVDLAMFRNRQLTVGLVSGVVVFVSIMGTIFVMPFYLENVLGFAPRTVGILMSVTPILLVIVAPVAGALADRYGERLITVIGLAFALVGFSLVATLGEDTTALGFVLRFVMVGLGMGTFQTPNNSSIMGAAPPGRSGVAGGLLGLTRALGQTSGIAVLGSLWAARVAARAQVPVGAEASAAPAMAQVGALHDMMHVVQVLVGIALALCAWDLARRRQEARRPQGSV